MIPVQVQYKVFGRFSLKWNRQLPEKWEECNPRQMQAIGALYLNAITDARFIGKMLSIPRFIAKRLDEYLVFSIVSKLEFMEEYGPVDRFIIPKIKKYNAPKPMLFDVSFGRFMLIDTYYGEYVANRTDESLDKFIAHLYTRGKFTQEGAKKNIPAFRKVSPEIKFAIVINYRLVMEWLMARYPEVFQKSPAAKGKKKVKTLKKDPGWIKVFDSIVDDDIINSDRYAEKPVHDIFRYLKRKIKENAKRPKI